VGLILDTTVLISADRRMLDVAEMLEELPLTAAEDLAISSISLIEFATGIGRATTQERRDRRTRFVQELRALLPVISFGADPALQAGLLNGELQNQGIILGSFDLNDWGHCARNGIWSWDSEYPAFSDDSRTSRG
jgi:predicted nucleic acid-binding protein